MCIAQSSLIYRQSKGINISTHDDMAMKLHMHHRTTVIYKFYEIPSIAY